MLIRLMNHGEWYDSIIEKLGIGLRVDVLSRSMINDALTNVDKSQKFIKIYIGNKDIEILSSKL